MPSKKTNYIITGISLLIYNFLFWHEKLGINLLLFTSILILVIMQSRKESIKHLQVRLLLAGTFLTGIMAVFNNSAVSKFTHILSFFLLTGSVHTSGLRTIYHILIGVVGNYSAAPKTLLETTSHHAGKIKPLQKVLYWIQMLLIPSVIFFLFFIIYNFANSQFGDLFSGFWNAFSRLSEKIFKYVSFSRVFFLLLGLIIIYGTLVNRYFGFMLSHESSLSDYLERKKMEDRMQKRPSNVLDFKINGLRKELRSGVILLFALNGILLALNIIDIKLLWFGFYPEGYFNMKAFVHEGTFLLIFSIVLSMILVLYYFRKNQNFYTRNKPLKILSYAWILQNLVLLVSVCLRNQQYIFYNGLAYKRIGLYAFLLLTAFGLITLIIKIKDLKSFFYLLRTNTWAAYLIFILLSFVNWDMVIVKNNLKNANGSGIDLDFYLDLSPQTYPVLIANLDKIEEQFKQHHASGVRWISCISFDDFKGRLLYKKEKFIASYHQYSWPSWNYSDYSAITNLSGTTHNLTLNKAYDTQR